MITDEKQLLENLLKVYGYDKTKELVKRNIELSKRECSSMEYEWWKNVEYHLKERTKTNESKRMFSKD